MENKKYKGNSASKKLRNTILKEFDFKVSIDDLGRMDTIIKEYLKEYRSNLPLPLLNELVKKEIDRLNNNPKQICTMCKVELIYKTVERDGSKWRELICPKCDNKDISEIKSVGEGA